MTKKKELEWIDWLAKTSERLQIINYNIKVGNDISPQDRDVLRAIYPLWFNQDMPFYEAVTVMNSQTVTETPLFPDKNVSKT